MSVCSRRRQRSIYEPHKFAASDFKSANGFLTTIWGPSLWMLLHTISLNYPCNPTSEQRTYYKKFFDSLQYVLPCGKCRENLKGNLKATNYGPHIFKNRETLSKWVYSLHSNVNKMLNKPNHMSYNEMRQMYEHFRARCSTVRNVQSKLVCKNAAAFNTASKMIGGGKTRHFSRRRTTKHDGCTEPLSGIKSQCVLRIIPVKYGKRNSSLSIDSRCYRRKI